MCKLNITELISAYCILVMQYSFIQCFTWNSKIWRWTKVKDSFTFCVSWYSSQMKNTWLYQAFTVKKKKKCQISRAYLCLSRRGRTRAHDSNLATFLYTVHCCLFWCATGLMRTNARIYKQSFTQKELTLYPYFIVCKSETLVLFTIKVSDA